MKMKIFTILFPILLVVYADDEKYSCRKPACEKYAEAWRIAVCAGSLYKDECITRTVFNNYLDMAKRIGSPTTSLYSIGFTTGLETKLVAGRIDDPILASGFSLEYSPKRIYHERLVIDLGMEFDKPVALFSMSDLSDVPMWNSDYLTGFQPTGHMNSYALYKSSGATKVSLNGDENCGNFATWIDENLNAKLKNTAVWFGKDHWCPILKNGVMEIVIADVIELDQLNFDGKMTKTLTVSSAVWRNGHFGKPTKEMLSVFQ